MAYEIKTETEIINDILVDIIRNTNKINDLNTGSIIRTLAEALGQELYLNYEQLKNIFDGTRILTASGEDLDNLGAIIGLTRIPGKSSEGYVSFIRETISSSSFNIPIGSIVSTQPGLEEVYKFTTIENKTFMNLIENEKKVFKDGVRKYKLTQRKVGMINEVSGEKSGNPVYFDEDVDFKVIKNYEGYIITNHLDLKTIDNCETADWTKNADAIAIATDNTNFIEGTKSLKLGKSGTVGNEVYYRKILASTVDIENKSVFMNIRIEDDETLDKIDKIYIRVSSDTEPTNNYYERVILKRDLKTGFEKYYLNYKEPKYLTLIGAPNIVNIKSLQIKIITKNNNDLFSSGKINMDFWYVSTAEEYNGDVIEFITPDKYPDDESEFFITWNPLSVDIMCMGNEVGEDHNVGKGTIIYKVSSIPFITSVLNFKEMLSGSNIESDENYRIRIINNASAPGKASVNALKNSIMKVPGVTSVWIEDMPLKSITNEPHMFNDLVNNYKLNNEVAYLDNIFAPTNILISNTFGGSEDYTYNTDYILNKENEILWLGATEPTDKDIFYVNYEAKLLGHVNVLIAGDVSPLTQTMVNNINEAINETKSSGVSVNWKEVEKVEITIECTIMVDSASGYNEETVRNEVFEALILWLNNKVIGEDVLLTEFYKAVVNTPGVKNVEIDNWNGQSKPYEDITITFNKIARPADGGVEVNL